MERVADHGADREKPSPAESGFKQSDCEVRPGVDPVK